MTTTDRKGLTSRQRAEIEARANAATPGPYETLWDECDCSDEPCGHGQFVYALRLPDIHTKHPDGPRSQDFEYYSVDEFTPATAVFLAKAREDVPALLEEVELLRKELDLLRAELPRMCARVREQVLAEAIDSVTTLQAQDADRYANGGGHGSWCSYGDSSHCHGSEAHATHERVLAALRAARTEVWDDTVPPGGYVCAAPDPTHPSGVCGRPVESEPCRIHNPEEKP